MKNSKTAILSICFLIVAAFVHATPKPSIVIPALSLNDSLGFLDGWKESKIPIQDEIVKSLELDDYLYRFYQQGSDGVSLYIGYYYSKRKLGAADSPLVCIPGSGWKISNLRKIQHAKEGTIQYPEEMSVMRIEKGETKELVVYWFQAYDRATSDTFRQKVATLIQKVRKGKEANAFVRIIVPIRDGGEQEAYDVARKFIQAFYPRFLDYITSS
jgi:EpsI family protein